MVIGFRLCMGESFTLTDSFQFPCSDSAYLCVVPRKQSPGVNVAINNRMFCTRIGGKISRASFIFRQTARAFGWGRGLFSDQRYFWHFRGYAF